MNEPHAGAKQPSTRKIPRLAWESVTLALLLAATWLIVDVSLHEASPAIVSAGRTGFTVLGLIVLSWWSTARVTVTSRSDNLTPAVTSPYRWWQLGLLALTGVTGYTVLSTLAIGLAGPALPTLIMALTPAVVLVAEALRWRARPPLRTIVGTAIAVVGAMIYVLPRLAGAAGSGVGLGAVLALAAMLSMAFYTLYFSTVNRHYQGAMAPRILPVFALGTIPLAGWAVLRLVAGEAFSWAGIGMLAFLGIVIYVPVYLLQHRILLRAGPSYAALLGLATPLLVGVSAAALQLAAVPAPVQVGGMLLTLGGMFVVLYRRFPAAMPRPAAPAHEV